MEVTFALRCRVCNALLNVKDAKEHLIQHGYRTEFIQTADPNQFYTLVPLINGWPDDTDTKTNKKSRKRKR